MGKINVKNGTPVGREHLCKRCTWGQFMTGFRESDLLVICTNASPNLTVPFPVHECSEFSDRNRPSWEQMDKLAIELNSVRLSARTRGFQAVTRVQPVRVDEDEDEAARGG
ncbi:MAG TPA: hypothetical protein VGI45_33430 [Terracidiphilus sp.]|jgi:hypothetical protein